jgi:hypothetical protein
MYQLSTQDRTAKLNQTNILKVRIINSLNLFWFELNEFIRVIFELNNS